MPKPRAARLETPTARRRLEVRKKPYWITISPSIALGYRRNAGSGTWSVRSTDGHGSDWIKRIALADDLERADGMHVLTYWQAIDQARALARRQEGAADNESRPLTVAEALDRYESDLKARGGDIYNAKRSRIHLPGLILSKPVALLGATELKRWRDSLAAKGLSPATINRTRTCLRAALELAAEHDKRIGNRREWRVGLRSLPDATVARNVVLDDATVRRIVAAAYDHDRALGLMVEIAATTGARPSEVARVQVADLDLADPPEPRLWIPRSGKGGSRDRARKMLERRPVPIGVGLATLLREAAAGRSPDAPLLLRSSGEPWGYRRSDHYRDDIRGVVAAVGLANTTTLYSLRHSAIVRRLLANTPVRIVADLSDTSVREIERHYARFIAEHSDTVARRGLLDITPPGAHNVLALPGRQS